MQKKQTNKQNLKIFLFYTIVILTGAIILPTLGIIGPTFILCGILTPIAGIIKLFGYIFNIDIPFITIQFDELTLNPVLEFLLTIFMGIILFFIGIYVWKLLIKYINMVRDKNKKMKALNKKN